MCECCGGDCKEAAPKLETRCARLLFRKGPCLEDSLKRLAFRFNEIGLNNEKILKITAEKYGFDDDNIILVMELARPRLEKPLHEGRSFFSTTLPCNSSDKKTYTDAIVRANNEGLAGYKISKVVFDSGESILALAGFLKVEFEKNKLKLEAPEQSLKKFDEDRAKGNNLDALDSLKVAVSEIFKTIKAKV